MWNPVRACLPAGRPRLSPRLPERNAIRRLLKQADATHTAIQHVPHHESQIPNPLVRLVVS